MTSTHARQSGERGAVIIHVALAMVALMALSTFVIDYGVFWLSRGQAQTAADAGALSGAISLMQDSYTDRSSIGPAHESALAAAIVNPVFGQAPSAASVDVWFPDDTGPNQFRPIAECPDSDSGCVQVDVHRTVARGNALPVFMGGLVGLANQDLRASATARVLAADTVECLKPWAVVDKWDDTEPGGWDNESTYDPAAGDSYTPPTGDSHGSGFYPFEEDGSPSPWYGMQYQLKFNQWQDVSKAGVISGWFSSLALAPPVGTTCGGGCAYRETIAGCTANQYSIGDTVPTEQGNMVGPTNQGTDDLIALDPNAAWDEDTQSISGSDFAHSPRIVPLVIVDPQQLFESGASGKSEVPISNFLGFFVEARGHGTVTGRLVSVPGMSAGEGGPAGPASWAQFISLIR